MYLHRYSSAFLYQENDHKALWYWIKDNGDILEVRNKQLTAKVSKEKIPDMIWLAIKIGAYESMSKVI
jgi:hypothetical protein